MPRTFTGTTSSFVFLSNPADNPVTIAAGAEITYAFGAITGSAAVKWAITNLGTINGNALAGVQLQGSGSVINGSATDAVAIIEGGLAVGIAGAGTVTNFGTLIGEVQTGAGSKLTNATAGATLHGAVIMGANSTIMNSGIITGTDAGYITGAGVITNFGTMTGLVHEGAGSHLNNAAATAVINGPVVLGSSSSMTNLGSIGGSTVQTGVSLTGASTLANGSAADTTASITGSSYGVLASAFYSGTTITNNGTITGGTIGASLGAGDSLVNKGRIAGNEAVYIKGSGGIVTNAAGAKIAGGLFGVVLRSGTSTITNTGSIGGATGIFAPLTTATTIINSGTITGTGGKAILVQAGETTVKIVPGAVFNGTVTAPGTTTNLLELAALAGQTGHIAGLDAQTGVGLFNNFHALAVDAGAKWQIGGTDNLYAVSGSGVGLTMAAGSVLTATGTVNDHSALDLSGTGTLAVSAGGQINVGIGAVGHAGTITVGGTALGGTIAGSGVVMGLVNNGGLIDAKGGTLTVTGKVFGSGYVEISPGSVLSVQAVLGTGAKFLAGGHETLAVGGIGVSPISGFVATDSIDLIGKLGTSFNFSSATNVLTVSGAAGALAAVHFAPGLSATSFSLKPDGHGGTFVLHT